ncbi:carbohydrate esterase family 4 protein [Piloderma croceum F 1598]|uniref:chitin deacetylase n=1 Tax=Piloderma croceum (strain F 1598) TaxID=765440 RepID=A0A0C3C726_PILCF|nr:carbohydrate esterase family 4 protein [Piloderma croceum F 1598]
MKFLTTVVLSVAALPALASAHKNRLRHHDARQAPAVAAVSTSSTSALASAPAGSAPAASSAAISASPALASGIGPPVSILSTNPTAYPLSSIVAGAPSQPTHALPSTPVAGAQPTLIPGAPPLPDITLINPANYPALDKPPPLDSPQVQQWIQEVKNSGVTIPNISPTLPGGCPANLQAVADDANRCWWTCGGCTRDSDITTCPQTLTWGLTYDDGPSPYTPDLLTYLDQNDLKATFFTIGSRVLGLPKVLQAEYMDGHQIAVHTWSHPPLTTLTNEQIVAELGWSKQVIFDVLGVTPNMMRPPYGDIDDRVRAICTAMGMTPIMWTRISPLSTFDTDDFDISGGLTTVGNVLLNWQQILGNVSTIDTGFIVLEHDLFQQAVDVATGYILPSALAHNPPFTIQPVVTCLNKPLSDAYIETNDNKTNPPVGSGSSAVITFSSGAPGSAQATGASGGSSTSNSAVGSGVGLSQFAAIITVVTSFMAGTSAFLF